MSLSVLTCCRRQKGEAGSGKGEPCEREGAGGWRATRAARGIGGHDALEAGLSFSMSSSRDMVESDCQQLDGSCATEVEDEQRYSQNLCAAEQRLAMLHPQHARNHAGNITSTTGTQQRDDQQCNYTQEYYPINASIRP